VGYLRSVAIDPVAAAASTRAHAAAV